MDDIETRKKEVKKRFKSFYELHLREKYAELEEKRNAYQQHRTQTKTKFFAVFGIWCGLCMMGLISSDIYLSDFMIRVYIIYFIIAKCTGYIKFAAKYKGETKDLVMDKILSFWGNLKYSDSTTNITPKTIEKSKLFDCFDDQYVDDNIQGTYNNTEINFAEQILTKKEYDEKGQENDVTIFFGILISLKFNKKFIGRLMLKSKETSYSDKFLTVFVALCILTPYLLLFGFLYMSNPLGAFSGQTENFPGIYALITGLFFFHEIKTTKKTKEQELNIELPEKIILEDTHFNNQWTVIAQDQIEARYILTTAFMERIQNLKKLFKTNHVECSFFDKQLLIAVYGSKDWFETTSLNISALDYRKIEEAILQLDSVFSIIDVLNLKSDKHLPQ